MDPRTAKRYAESPSRPEYTLTGPKPTKLDPYKQKIDQMLEEAPYSAVRILEKLQEEGFDGKYSIVKEYVRGKKMDLEEPQFYIAQSLLPITSYVHPYFSSHFLTPFPDAFSLLLGVYLFFLTSANS